MPEELPAGVSEEKIESSVETRGGEQVKKESPFQGFEKSPEAAKESAKEKYNDILSQVKPVLSGGGVSSDGVATDAKSVYAETDAGARVTQLLSLAETKGVEHAVKVAVHLNDFYVLDRMHDELAEKFYDALKAKGLLHDE